MSALAGADGAMAGRLDALEWRTNNPDADVPSDVSGLRESALEAFRVSGSDDAGAYVAGYVEAWLDYVVRP